MKTLSARRNTYLAMLLVLLFFSGGLFTRCANVGVSPQGGPKDTLPPRVVGVSPPYNSTNLWPRRITIDFDEYVQLKNLQNEFFTSPFLERRPTVTVKGRGIVIDINTDLDSNTTYVFNLGSSVVDNNEGNPYYGLKYVFSTGDYVDSLYMSGLVTDAATMDSVPGAYLLFYDPAVDSVPDYDSVVFNSQALAVARTMPNGIFVHSNLKPMDYRVYAMLDKNGNQVYDPGVDHIAFLDSTVHPEKLPSFMLWYDTTVMYTVAEPQLFFRTFVENPERRQNLSSSSRPEQQQLIMRFSSKNPVIERFDIRGIDPANIIVEQTREERDSILYWIDLDPEFIPDTLRADLVYERHDSIGNLYFHEQELSFVYNRPFVSERERKKMEEEEAQDTIRKSKMKMTFFPSSTTVNPDENFQMRFDLPVRRMDTGRMTLTHTDLKGESEEVPFRILQDTLHIRNFTVVSDWRDADKYSLLIPSGAIETIDGELNDTITYNFSILDPEKLAVIILNLYNTNPEYEYIVQVLEEKGTRSLKERAHLTEGRDTLNYIPTGTVRLKFTEDRNRNGKWDTGDLVRRIQPENVAIFFSDQGTPFIPTRANWENEIDIDVGRLFAPRVHTGLVEAPDLPADSLPESLVDSLGAAPADSLESYIRSDSPFRRISSREAGKETIAIVDLTEEKRQKREQRQAKKADKRLRREQRKNPVETETEGAVEEAGETGGGEAARPAGESVLPRTTGHEESDHDHDHDHDHNHE